MLGVRDLDPALVERLAAVIHERYCARARQNGATTERRIGCWDELSEAMKESNRCQAADIPRKLAAIDAMIVVGGDESFGFTEDEVEMLAKQEHGRWARERDARGWKRGVVRSESERTHPMIVPFSDLPEKEKQKDRDVILDIPIILREVGLGIRRIKHHGTPVL